MEVCTKLQKEITLTTKLIQAMFPKLEGRWRKLNLNKYAKVLREDTDGTNPLLDPKLFGEWVNLLHKTLGTDYSWGGYMEDREELLDGTYLQTRQRIHLGIDYWVPEGTHVVLPKDGKLVQSRYDPDQNGGWGGQLIFNIDEVYVIFGHLAKITEQYGKLYKKGDYIGEVAPIWGNGGWYPHLHLQCMMKFDANVDGYGTHDSWRAFEFPNPEAVATIKEW